MNTIKQLMIGIILISFGCFVSCVDVGDSIDDAVDQVTDALDHDGSSNNGNNGNAYGNQDDDDDYYYGEDDSGDDEGDTAYSDPDDPSGGIDYFPESQKGSSRNFLGTYEIKEYYTTCNDYYWGPGLELPSVLRAYSYGDYIDFETSLSELVWGALIYPDDTFDFRIYYQDTWGNPSVTLTCTCSFYEYSYWADTMDCTCDASNDDSSCTLYYEQM